MNITMRTEYALRALYEISLNDGLPMSRKRIAERQGISVHFLEQIFLQLQKAGIILSVRGPGGGFLLTRDCREITLWDIYVAVERRATAAHLRCFPGMDGTCERFAKCNVKSVWHKINHDVRQSMQGINLKDIGAPERMGDSALGHDKAAPGSA